MRKHTITYAHTRKMCTYTYSCTETRTYANIHAHMPLCTYTCVHPRTHAYMHIHKRICIRYNRRFNCLKNVCAYKYVYLI